VSEVIRHLTLLPVKTLLHDQQFQPPETA
jgi:hypothetical protein